MTSIAEKYAQQYQPNGEVSLADLIQAAVDEQAETHALELRAYEATVQNLDQRIREIEAQRAPEGYVMVPVEPTERMLKAGERGIGVSSYVRKGMTIREYRFFKSGWDAMLSAAPEGKK